MIRTKALGASLLVMACFVIAGCEKGEKLVKVNGQIVENGQPVPVSNYEEGVTGIRVIFVPLDESGKPSEAIADTAFAGADGKFLMYGNMGTGISPGKYRVAVQYVDSGSNGGDKWKGKFGPTTSPFEYDISGSSQELTIDLAKKSAS